MTGIKHIWLLGEKYIVLGKNDPRFPDKCDEPGYVTIRADKATFWASKSEPFK